ncbi:MAG: hypothetical protein ACI4RM_01565 [Ruminococcus sp.]
MKKFRLITITILLILALTSCSQIVSNTADQIRLNNWRTVLKNESIVTLNFNEDIAKFTVEKNEKTYLKLKGVCIFDKESFVIFDESTSYKYSFDYSVTGNKLKLTYGDNSITLKKLKNV